MPQLSGGLRRAGERPRVTKLVVLGVGVLGLVWIPTVVEQLTGSPGNLTLLLRFFTTPHPTHSLASGVWATAAVASIPFQGLYHEMSSTLGGAWPGGGWFLLVAVALSVVSLVFGLRRRQPFSVAIGVAGVFGIVITAVSVTRIVGPIYGYLIVWEIAVPMVVLIGLVVMLKDGSLIRILVTLFALALATVLCVGEAQVSVGHGDPKVASAWLDASAHLRPTDGPVFLDWKGTDKLVPLRWQTFEGLFAVPEVNGYRPKTRAQFMEVVGAGAVSSGRERVAVVLEPPSWVVEHSPGFIGHLPDADLVLTRR